MSVEYLIPYKHALKSLCKSKHFHGDIKENVNGCFFSEHSVDRMNFVALGNFMVSGR